MDRLIACVEIIVGDEVQTWVCYDDEVWALEEWLSLTTNMPADTIYWRALPYAHSYDGAWTRVTVDSIGILWRYRPE